LLQFRERGFFGQQLHGGLTQKTVAALGQAENGFTRKIPAAVE
jgi:hypothetical protein